MQLAPTWWRRGESNPRPKTGCKDLEEFQALPGYTFPGLVHPEDVEATQQSIRHHRRASLR